MAIESLDLSCYSEFIRFGTMIGLRRLWFAISRRPGVSPRGSLRPCRFGTRRLAIDDQEIALASALLASGSLKESSGFAMFAGRGQFFIH
jgi:hypothetical protein